MKKQTQTMKKQTKLTDTRDLIRFITLLGVPWLGWLTAGLFGIEEFEFETELVVTAMFIIFGTYWCSWFCPFGNLNYFMGKLGAKIFPNAKLNIPTAIDKPLRYVKYAMLALFIWAMVTHGVNYFFGDHMEMYHATWLTSLYIASKKYWIILLPLFIPNFFCKYLCFQKAGYNIVNRLLPITVISRDADKCIECEKCSKVCPMDLPVHELAKISGSDCLGCYNCVDEDVCPSKADAIKLRFLGKEVKPLYFGLTAMTIYIVTTAIVLRIVGNAG